MIFHLNKGLIAYFVKQFYSPSIKTIEYHDLHAAGVEGLMRAIHKFDLKKAGNSKFSSYAALWIKALVSQFK